MTFHIANLTVAIEGVDPVSMVLRRWLESFSGGGEDVDLEFRIAPRWARASRGHGGLSWELAPNFSPSGSTVIMATGTLRHRLGVLPAPVYRVAHPAYLSQAEHMASTFMGEVFVGVTHEYGLAAGQFYLPAAAATHGDRTLAIVGPGASGKSGSVLRLCLNHGWKYLSDDMALIRDAGVVEVSPKPIEVAARNLAGDGRLRAWLSENRSPLDRLAWQAHARLRAGRGLRRVAPACELLGADHVGSPQQLTDVIIVERTGVGPVEVREDSRALATSAVIRLLEAEQAHSALSRPGALLQSIDPAAARSAQRDMIDRVLEGARLIEISLPKAMNESAAEDAILDCIHTRMGIGKCDDHNH